MNADQQLLGSLGRSVDTKSASTELYIDAQIGDHLRSLLPALRAAHPLRELPQRGSPANEARQGFRLDLADRAAVTSPFRDIMETFRRREAASDGWAGD